MRTLRELITKLAAAIAAQRKLSNFMCNGCELRDYCNLPSSRRQLCCESRAIRPRWWWENPLPRSLSISQHPGDTFV